MKAKDNVLTMLGYIEGNGQFRQRSYDNERQQRQRATQTTL